MTHQDEKYLLIGGSGFIGRNIQRKFNEQDVIYKSVGAVDLRCDLQRSLHGIIMEFKPTRIVFLAAKVGSMASISQNPFAYITENVRIFIDAFSAIKQCFEEGHSFKILNIISNCVYPASSDYQNENDVLKGPPHFSVDPFAQAKRMLMSLGNNFAISHNASVLNLILANAFGPYDHLDSNRSHALTGMIVRMIQAKRLRSDKFEVWGTGAPIRSWLYAPDFAEQVIRIFDEQAMWTLNVLNFPATVQKISIKELALQIAREVEFEGRIVFDASKGDGDPVKILNSDNFETFYSPKRTKFSDALRDAVMYFENNV